MRETRDAVEAKIRDPNRIRVSFDDFHEFTAFNDSLRDQERTVELFKWLDEVEPEDAARVYGISEAALIKEKEYEICGKYVNPVKDAGRICDSYERGVEWTPRFGNEYLKVKEDMFVDKSALLIEILVRNDRTAEAKEASDRLIKFAKEKKISARLEKAINAALKKKPVD